MSDNRASVYEEDGVVVYRASAVGACELHLLAARLGFEAVPFDADAVRRMAEGDLHEPAILSYVDKEYPLSPTASQDSVVLPITSTVVVRGHVDGRTYGGDRVVEVKALAKSGYDSWRANGWKAFPRYAWQVSIYMHALGVKGLFVVKDRNSGAIDITEVDEPPVSLVDIKQKVLAIEAAAATRELSLACQERFCMCPYGYLRTGSRTSVAGSGASKGDLGEVAEVDRLAMEWEELLADEKVLKARREEWAERMRAAWEGKGRKQGTNWWVSWEAGEKSYLDTDAMTDDGIDLDRYRRTKPTRPGPKVTRNKGEDDDG